MQTFQFTSDIRHGESLVAPPKRDSAVMLERIAIDLDAIPMLCMADVMDADVILQSPEERYCRKAFSFAENIPCSNDALDRKSVV